MPSWSSFSGLVKAVLTLHVVRLNYLNVMNPGALMRLVHSANTGWLAITKFGMGRFILDVSKVVHNSD